METIDYKQKIKDYMNSSEVDTLYKSMLNNLFPELKEYEEMKETCIFYLNKQKCYVNDVSCIEKCIAWLEEQGKQKPVLIIPKFRAGDEIKTSNEESLTITKIDDKGYWSEDLFICDFDEECLWDLVEQKPNNKVEPKFHNGQWIVWQDKCYKVNYNGCGYELVDQDGLSTSLEYGTVDENAHLWDITKDVKDGDVIYSRHNTESFEWIGIFKSLDKENKRVFFYGFWNNMANSFCISGDEAYVLYDDFSPATKEQRDLLFQKMKEAGCEWDAEKLILLKAIEQKPIQDHASIDPQFYKPQLCQTDEQVSQRMVSAEAKEAMYSKQEWSEEDENIISDAEVWLDTLCDYLIDSSPEFISKVRVIISKLKSLKERVQPQPMQEWSEEDDYNVQCLVAKVVSDIQKGNVGRNQELIAWLKSLKPNRWKPSDEQMKALQVFLAHGCAAPDKEASIAEEVVDGLYNDLKKLRGE